MQIKNLENQTEFLLSAALAKCGNLDEAQDLTQDTLLAALDYLEKGGEIKEMRGWLLTVMNRRFYQNLRRKYKILTITIGESFDILDEKDYFENIGQTSEAEQVRKAVAYLAKIHREVIIRHYMRGESVQKIADTLNIPQGTVKSRLATGREQLKKELIMDNYEKQSYEPIQLHISNSGNASILDEPRSLIKDDLIAQNLLYLAYKEPITEVELSKAIGVPMAYVEPVIKKLMDGELMKRTGHKVYTDFMISTIENQQINHIPAVKKFVEEEQDLFFKGLKKGLEKIRKTEYYKRFTEHQKHALELYAATYLYSNGLYHSFNNIYSSDQIFPDRPNGGKWIAFGIVIPQVKDSVNNTEDGKYGFSGMRTVHFDNYFDTKSVELKVYDLTGFASQKTYYSGNNGDWIEDEDLAKILYILESGINPKGTGFNVELLKRIPKLVNCGILRYDGDKPTVDVPVLKSEELNSLNNIINESKDEFMRDIKEVFTEFLKDKKQKIPAHLTSVPLQKQYIAASMQPVMASIRLAVKQGIINSSYDYDDDSDPDRRFPYSMVFVVNKDK